MPICGQCKVEVDPGTDVCPLCNTPIHVTHRGGEHKRKHGYPDLPATEKEEAKQGMVRFLAWEAVSVVLATVFLIVFLTDFLVSMSITWGWYPLSAISLAWLLVTFPLLLPRALFRISIFSAISVMLFLAFLDFIENGVFEWFPIVAVPIFVLVAVTATVTFFACMKAGRKGANIAAFILAGVGVITAGVDLITRYSIERVIAMSWSVSVIIPVGCTAGFLVYVHYRLSKTKDLKRWFQI